MQLDHDELTRAVRGVVATDSCDDSLVLRRILEKRCEQMPAPQALRARCTAGVCLAVRSDASRIELELELAGRIRSWAGIDIEVDGTPHATLHLEPDRESWRGIIALGSTDVEREIRIHLPQIADCRLRRLRVPGGSTLAAAERRPRRLLCLGDSITQGMDAHAPATSYPIQLARLLDAELHNQGIGGAVFDRRYAELESAPQPDVITVAYGTNDWGRGLDDRAVAEEGAALLQALHDAHPDSPIIAILPLWRHDAHGDEGQRSLHSYNATLGAAFRELAQVRVVDGLELVPHRRDCFADGLHPNELGFLHLGMGLARHLRVLGLLA